MAPGVTEHRVGRNQAVAKQAGFKGEFADRDVLERSVRKLLDLVDRRGGNASAVLAAVGITRKYRSYRTDGLAKAGIEELRLVLTGASVAASDLQAQLVGRPPFRNSDWRLLFYCLVSSRTLREAIRRCSEVFEAVDGRLGYMTLVERGGVAHVGMGGDRGPDPELGLFVAVQGLTMHHAIFSWLIGRKIPAVGQLDMPESLLTLYDEAALPFELEFDAVEPALVFSSSYLDQPVIRSIEDCEGIATLTFLFGTVRRDDPEEIAERTRRTLSLILKDERRMLPLDRVAAMLGMSRMTLRRRLSAAGTSFNRIRDDCRRSLGLELLRQSDLPIEEIAIRLDFCDSDAFRRAVRSWVAMSPTEYRRHGGEP